MTLTSLRPIACALLFVWMAPGCMAPKRVAKAIPVPVTAQKNAKRPSYWRGTGVSGEPKIVIRLDQQRAYFFKGEKLVGDSAISSGRKGFETPPGTYKVIQRSKNHVSNLYGNFVGAEGQIIKRDADTSKEKPPEGATFEGAKMPFFLRFHGGYGMHAGRLPGRRASHGCVRLPRHIAEHFFNNAPLGTPVIVE